MATLRRDGHEGILPVHIQFHVTFLRPGRLRASRKFFVPPHSWNQTTTYFYKADMRVTGDVGMHGHL